LDNPDPNPGGECNLTDELELEDAVVGEEGGWMLFCDDVNDGSSEGIAYECEARGGWEYDFTCCCDGIEVDWRWDDAPSNE